MIYGIPNFKLEKEVVLRRWRWLEAGGIKFVLNCDISMQSAGAGDLAAFRACASAPGGAGRDRRLQGTGHRRPRCWPAGHRQGHGLLITSNRHGLGDAVPEFDSGLLNAAGKDVVVIGGGDTAMDCVRTAVRQGARSVKCLYRRDRPTCRAPCAR